MSTLFRAVMEAAGNLFRSWYAVDRIRISLSSGRLLRLKTGDTIVLMDELYIVTQRNDESTGPTTQISYVLDDSAVERSLVVTRSNSNGIVNGRIDLHDGPVTISDTDVVILNPEPSHKAETSSHRRK